MILPKIVYLDTAKESLFKTKIEKAWIFALFCRLVAVYLMTQLLSTIAKVKKHTNRNLTIDGILLTLVDGRTNLAKSTVR